MRTLGVIFFCCFVSIMEVKDELTGCMVAPGRCHGLVRPFGRELQCPHLTKDGSLYCSKHLNFKQEYQEFKINFVRHFLIFCFF